MVPSAHCALYAPPPGAPNGYRGSPVGEPRTGPSAQVDVVSNPSAGLTPGLCSGAPYVPPEWYWNAGVMESLSCLKFKISVATFGTSNDATDALNPPGMMSNGTYCAFGSNSGRTGAFQYGLAMSPAAQVAS